MLLDQMAQPGQAAAAFHRRHFRPRAVLEGMAGTGDGQIDIGLAGGGDGGENLAVRGAGDIDAQAGNGVHLLAADDLAEAAAFRHRARKMSVHTWLLLWPFG